MKAERVRSQRKLNRIARDKARAKPLPCGHGSRHFSKYDGICRVCVREGKRLPTDPGTVIA